MCRGRELFQLGEFHFRGEQSISEREQRQYSRDSLRDVPQCVADRVDFADQRGIR